MRLDAWLSTCVDLHGSGQAAEDKLGTDGGFSSSMR